MDRFLAAVDAGRSFDTGSLIGDVLDYAAAEGFGAVMREGGIAQGNSRVWETPRRFRERYLIAALEALGGGNA